MPWCHEHTNNDSNGQINDVSAIHELAIVSKERNTVLDSRHLAQCVSDIAHTLLDCKDEL